MEVPIKVIKRRKFKTSISLLGGEFAYFCRIPQIWFPYVRQPFCCPISHLLKISIQSNNTTNVENPEPHK